uniref:high mobility group B protein 7 n=1 Tax=Erigeron canadensis TaxID=72917 RepID=UPI001CB9662D|nr:high mobility group B protein 7 [Erigeron canadensis]
MAYQSRTRKRVNAILVRAPNGSAFQTCESCGVSVAVALVDMHQCENKKGVKKLKVKNKIVDEKRFQDQPRSEFRFFMESFVKDCDIIGHVEMDRKGFDTWKNMSSQERLKYKLQAKKVNDAYYQKIVEEEDQMVSCVDEEADSAEVGKFDKTVICNDNDSDSSYYDDYAAESDCIGLFPWL